MVSRPGTYLISTVADLVRAKAAVQIPPKIAKLCGFGVPVYFTRDTAALACGEEPERDTYCVTTRLLRATAQALTEAGKAVRANVPVRTIAFADDSAAFAVMLCVDEPEQPIVLWEASEYAEAIERSLHLGTASERARAELMLDDLHHVMQHWLEHFASKDGAE